MPYPHATETVIQNNSDRTLQLPQSDRTLIIKKMAIALSQKDRGFKV